MNKIFLESYIKYLEHMSMKSVDFWKLKSFESRRNQCQQFLSALNERFNFDKLICLETGASTNYDDGVFGLFLGIAVSKVGGEMYSVDISKEKCNKSREIFTEILPHLNYNTKCIDSVEYIKQIDYVPNLVHLDSYDFNINDPLPSALHGWREFDTLESKMPSGAIIIIDDNYRQYSELEWHYYNGTTEYIPIKYPMLGKGAHIYQWVLNNQTNWELIGSHYDQFENLKIIIQKK